MRKLIYSSLHVGQIIYVEKEQKTVFDKNGTRFFYYGQIEHDDYEKKKLDEFDKFLTEGKLDLNREFWNRQKVLQFLQGNGYNEKNAYQAMKDHEKFREEYLGPNNEKCLYEPVADLIVSIFCYLECRYVLPLWKR